MTLSLSLKSGAPIPLDVSFAVQPGQLLALVGPSGSGKTTILRSIAGLWTPTQAHITVGQDCWVDTKTGRFCPPHRRSVGFVVQNFALFPHMTAAGNIAAAMENPDPAEIHRLLELVKLEDRADRKPAELSGGQQQRVALARALARRPSVLLLDEPFSAVDKATRDSIHAELMALRAHLDMPVILVTHDMGEAQFLADRLAVIDKGGLVKTGTVAEVMSDAAALRAMGLRELAGFVAVRVVGTESDGLTRVESATGPLWLPLLNASVGEGLRIRILAHEVILSRARPVGLSAQNILPCRVIRVTAGDGPGSIVHLAVGPDEFYARITQRAAAEMGLSPGDDVHAILKTMSVSRDQILRS